MGQPVAGNPSQFMMERAFAAAGLEWRYLTLEVSPENLPAAVAGMKAMGFRGGNFTIPHKVAVIPHLKRLSEAAELMGAVNCIFAEEDGFVGENTDGKGFVSALKEVIEPEGKKVVLFGAGGAARAIAVELGLNKAAAVDIVNRDAGRGRDLAKLLSERVGIQSKWIPWNGQHELAEDADIVINGTSIGLCDSTAMVPVDPSTFRESMVVADVIFNPPMTPFLQAAQDKGCRNIDGLGMLVNQGVIGFKIWTGIDPDPGVMREALEEYLGI
ncbi:shikimate dehydrogenase [Blastopirellula marina]|uniref:Shikimate dehydrogenase (NADP(+)) n=1 Tax=Blastopirellula marina TaxID=124 RepID=A0A2S8GQE0_9BACT|nr:shikimate dehydrogenase [Blastopirellula marina]PQO46234.1 shikimate dehydrogenase [Blastopirellula marina]